MSVLTIWVRVSWFTCCQEWGILNPSISSLELSWYRFHLKPSLRNVAIVVLIYDPSFLLFARLKKFLFVALQQAIFFLSSFYYQSSSWRLYMVVHQGFLSFFNCSSGFLSKLWPAKLYSKINMVLNTCFVLRSSSILHRAFQSALLPTLSLKMVLCHSC